MKAEFRMINDETKGRRRGPAFGRWAHHFTVMKTPNNQLMLQVLKAAFGLATILCFSVVAGCATDKEPPPQPLSNQDYSILYPREDYQSASPSERREMEQDEAEKQERTK